MIRSIVLAVLSASIVLACHSVPRPEGAGVRSTGAERVAEVAPIDVAVAPIVNASGAPIPAAELRSAFHKGLVQRRYSPLALDYVDRRVVDAAYTPGASDEQAALTITVERWDTSLWTTHGAVIAKVSAKLVDARGGEVLWSGSTDRRFDFLDLREHLSTEGARVQYACDQIASEMLSRLPSRTARPGRLPAGS